MVEESGFDFTPPDVAWFRFEDLPSYRRLSGAGVAERDFTYWDPDRGLVVLLEIKDYTGRDAPGDLAGRLIAKGRDSLVMLQSAWRGGDTRTGATLAGELPERLRVRSSVRLIFVLKVDAATRIKPISTMKDRIAWSIRAYADLLGLRCDTLVMNQDKASEIGLPLRVSPPPR
ncbi:hypothetical protein BE20_56655 [Sorangium cellulosum]|uniref:Uncharacterized protein n=1 Tax=Sorangium cellulosum TaxID=56 RepID=A0A150RRY9_SORCE|nr:hypothetical protein BE18_15285 [Sorangium cellulosum]KYG00156.1 hypothetical protein BE20_56655 [Sorangium cellulosum]